MIAPFNCTSCIEVFNRREKLETSQNCLFGKKSFGDESLRDLEASPPSSRSQNGQYLTQAVK